MIPPIKPFARAIGTPTLAVSGTFLAVSLAGAVFAPADSLNIAAPFWWLPSVILLALVASLVRRLRIWAVLLLVGHAAAGVILFAPLWETRSSTGEQPSMRVVTYNINGWNTGALEAARWILSQNPDFVVLLEATPFHQDVIELIAQELPYVYDCSATTRCSAMLFARMPAQDVWPLANGDADNRRALSALTARFHSENGWFSITAAHLPHPWPLGSQANHVEELATALATVGRHGVLVGDFNSAPWTFAMRRLAAAGELRLASGARGTWPARMPAFVRLPLDQVYLGRCVSGRSLKRGSAFGSDHFLIVADIAPTSCHG